ncbi:hypothetical protein ZIOFF_066845 [Zingiber officinale]|uniref:Uncharacterized protein n=1 Tax=Zingiber officinale TaxID=94328 RepID=A0A8J5F5F6_ZINOF|nr:hypothetical protein ZIOFF_066845 [Zingiber officinale]
MLQNDSAAGAGKVPVVVDWVIGGETCEVASCDLGSYACISNHSVCVDSSNGPGYLCNYSTGYRDNPYVSDGCQGGTHLKLSQTEASSEPSFPFSRAASEQAEGERAFCHRAAAASPVNAGKAGAGSHR